jgi:peroxiredoxin
MKKDILFSLFIFLSIGLFSQNNASQTKFTLNGKITAKNTKVVYLQYIDNTDKNVKDSCIIKNGTFTFSGHVKDLTQAKLKGTTKFDSEKIHNTIDFYLEPVVMQIVLTENHFDKASIIGSITQKENEYLTKLEFPAIQAIDSLRKMDTNISQQIPKASNRLDSLKLESEVNRIESLVRYYQNINWKMEFEFIYTHPDSYISASKFTILHQKISLDSTNLLFNRLSPRIINSRDGMVLSKVIRIKNNTSVGKMAPDFTSIDINGNPLSLSSFRGKSFVLLDFWASTCGPCRSQYPHLKVLYQKYHPRGFEVVGISINDTKSEWLKAIKDDGIDIWKQIPFIKDLNFKNLNIPSDENLYFMYEVRPIPIQILIDKNGMIVGRWDGASSQNEKELDKKLKECMGL